MKRARFTEEQIIGILRENEAGPDLALRLVGERQIGSEAFEKQLTELVRLSETMDDGEQVKRIVKDLQDAKAELSPDGG